MKKVAEKHLGVTLAFAVSAALILVVIGALDAAGAGGEFTRGVEDWTAVGRSVVGVALLAGIMVDAMRWAGTQLWP